MRLELPGFAGSVVDSEFGAGDEGPAELFDRRVIFGFDKGEGTLFFRVVGIAGKNVLEGFADHCLRAFDFEESVEEGRVKKESVKEVSVGEEHRLLDREHATER